MPPQITTSPTGRFVRAGAGSPACRAFVPNPLPVEVVWGGDLVSLVSASDRALGELGSIGQMVPNPHLLVAPFMRREAVQSSRIEGTEASIDDLYLFEASPNAKSNVADVREVHNYLKAMDYGLDRAATLPLSKRMMCELHQILMTGVRGQERRIGEFRRTQNWIGAPRCTIEEATYIPPPPNEMEIALDELESYLNSPSDLPPLVRMAMVHYQFEAIHPFEDGNGRIGRLLIVLSLCMNGILPGPLLYISDALERHRPGYYECLLGVTKTGAWNQWIKFFLRSATEAARDGVLRAHRLIKLQEQYRSRFESDRAITTQPLIDYLFSTPVVTVSQARQRLKVSPTAAQAAINRLVKANILRELTGQQRNRIYGAHEILKAVSDPLIS